MSLSGRLVVVGRGYWIPAYAGMTKTSPGMTGKSPGMTGKNPVMMVKNAGIAVNDSAVTFCGVIR